MSSARARRTLAVGAGAALLATLTGCAASDSGFAAASGQAVAAHTSTPRTPQAPIVTWFRQVSPLVATVEQSITWAQWTVRRPTHRGLRSACVHIRTNVAAVRAAAAPPDTRAATALAAEMRAFDRAAGQCLAGDLEAAGASVNTGHRYAEISGRRIVTLVHAAS